MTGHVMEWLGAYVDGELRGVRLRWVESHLAQCNLCQGELEGLRALSATLQESPAMETPERFVARVGLRLPRSQERPPAQKALELSWKLVPAGLLFALAFVHAVFVTGGLVQLALSMGLGGDVAVVLLPSTSAGVSLADLFSLSQANLLEAAEMTMGLVQGGTAYVWIFVLYLVLLVVIGLLYWSWLATWWARRRHRELTASNHVG
jgi:predicted anti-sigma-YlaC factor YlaD